MKICSKCGLEKDISQFYKRKDTKDGLRSDCKECRNLENKKYVDINKDYISEYNRKYREENKDRLKEFYREFYDNNKDELKKLRKVKYSKNKENILNSNKNYRLRNKEKVNRNKRDYYLNNKDKIKMYQDNRRQEIKEYNKNYSKNNRYSINLKRKNKINSNPLEKLKSNIRCAITTSFKVMRFKKPLLCKHILGCSFDELKSYLESKFEPWMTWDNRGMYNGELNYGWDIDHIIPLSSAKSEEELILLNNYENLQPLCSKINRDIKRNNLNFIY